MSPHQPHPKIVRKRYKRVHRFFARLLLHALFWDVLFNLPGLRWFRKAPLERWQGIARDYRALATELGGVMIKLGQFLSTRVDILPIEIINELAELQDEVPPEPFEAIRAAIEKDLGEAVGDRFLEIDPRPLGSASLAQAHLVKLRPDQEIVLKVLRPGIEARVETDLTALRRAIGWLKYYRPLLRRVDLDWLMNEFASVTRRELDMQAEGRNVERMALTFEGDERIYIPKVCWEHTGQRTLALENVAYIKINDTRAMNAVGVDPVQVADRLYDLYMKQVFETHFVHVDPHPGNLFVRPLPTASETARGIAAFYPGDEVPHHPRRTFQVAFVDFGMTTTVAQHLQQAMRNYVIALGTRDPDGIIQSYVDAGLLLPHADLTRIREAHRDLFRHFWGVRVADLRDVAISEARTFLRQYREIIFEAPFQFQVDLLFIMRAVGILTGLANTLDPNFDVWEKTVPYAERYMRGRPGQGGVWRKGIEQTARLLLSTPARTDRLLTELQRGNVTVKSDMAPGTRKLLSSISGGIRRIYWAIAGAACLLAGSVIYASSRNDLAAWGLWGLAGVLLLTGLRRR